MSDEHHYGRSLFPTLVSLLCALAGLFVAVTGASADETFWLVGGVALGVFGPVLTMLATRRSA